MAFERFTQTGGSYRPRVSVRSNGQIGFSQGSVNRFKLGEFKFCILFFDRENNKIGIKPCNSDQEKGVCKLQIKNDNGTVSAKAFLEFYEIDYRETKAYDAIWDEKEEMIVVNIKDQN